MSVRVMVAFSNMILSEGVRRILEEDGQIEVAEVLKPGTRCGPEKLKKVNPDVVLVDFITLYNSFTGVDTDKRGFILLDTDCGRENIVSAIISKGLSGVLLGNATPELLKKGVKSVARGEVWLDKFTVKNLLHGINAIGSDRSAKLSKREKEIVALTGQGYKNKEIASKLCISEPTVKTHLRRIFQKLGIKNRSQLITYALKSKDITEFFNSRTG